MVAFGRFLMATGNPEFPSRVVCIGTLHVKADTAVPGTPIRETPEHTQLLAEFPSGAVITITASTVNAASPGRILPSSISRAAPPPVDTCDILSLSAPVGQ